MATFTQNYIYDATKIQITGNPSGTASLILPNTSATLKFADVYTLTGISAFSAVISATGSDNVKFVMILDSLPKYWNGSAWVTSDETYAKANTAAEVNTNAATLITTGTHTLQLELIFFGSGTTTPSISNVSVSINYVPGVAAPAGQCNVYCFLQDIAGIDLATVTNAQLIAINDSNFSNNSYTVAKFTKIANFVTDSLGTYAMMNVIQTDGSGQKIRFMVTYQPNALTSRIETIRFKPQVIPVLSSVNLVDLTIVDTAQLL